MKGIKTPEGLDETVFKKEHELTVMLYMLLSKTKMKEYVVYVK